MNDVVILSAKRTPTGSYGGHLSSIGAVDLGVSAVRAALSSSSLAVDKVETLVMGQVLTSNAGQNPARQVAIASGLPVNVTACQVNKVCASGMKAIQIVMNEIALGQIKAGIAGGMESMSNVPHYITNARFGMGFGNKHLLDGLMIDGLKDAYSEHLMGVFADATADKFQISRDTQDDYAKLSFERARRSNFEAEVVSITVENKRQSSLISTDEQIAKGDFEKMKKLKPAFSNTGSVTAANASPMNDGASAVVMTSKELANKLGLEKLATCVAYAEAEHEPEWFTTAPISATKKVLKMAGLELSDIDLFEVNEAFAVVALAFQQELKIPMEKFNVKGGALALGHALGNSGCRIVVTLCYALKEQNKQYGLAAICNGGGGASALIIKNESYVES